MDLSNNDKLTIQILDDLYTGWQPHSGQKKVGKALYLDEKKQVFIQCGRKWGKTDFVIHALWRHALLNPGSACYYFCPQLKQGKEIVWSSGRIQRFGPKKYIKKIDNSELRVTFKNGSFIKVDGSDNHEAYRGITPDFSVYDEFKDFHPKFHEGYAPNFAVKQAPLIIIGTPPQSEGQYTDLAKECMIREDSSWFQMSSYENPHISAEWLDREKQKLIARGEEDVWFREYMAEMVRGGKNSIFPMFNRDAVTYHEDIIREIARDRHKMEWYVAVDPGTTTAMAALFCAVNPYNKKFYVLDELYITDQRDTSVNVAFPNMIEKCDELFPRGDIDEDWIFTYDEAAAWFSTEVQGSFPEHDIALFPTQKHLNKKEEGLSLIKDMLLSEIVVISDRCEFLSWEMLNYVRDDKGKIPKKNDHLIDCFRYALGAAQYDLNDVVEAKHKKNVDERPMVSMEADMKNDIELNDWTAKYDFKY